MIKRVNKVILVSQEGMDHYLKKFPRYKNKFVLIPTFVDTELFKITDKKTARIKYGIFPQDKVILFAGRFDVLKGLDLLIDAFQRIKKAIPDAKLFLVGGGSEKERLEKKTADLESDGIKFMGMMGHGELSQMINCADVFVLTSLWEGMPLAALEAMACGIPVVSTDVGQLSEIVKDGYTGYLIHRRDTEETAEKIIVALEQAPSMTAACRMTAERYSLPVVANRVFDIYKEA